MGFAAQAAAWLFALAASVTGIGREEAMQVKKVGDLQGKQVPSYSMKTPEGKTFTKTSTKGKIVLMDFWASWCSVCKKASPQMQRLHEKYGKKGLVVVGVNTMEENANSPKYAIDYKKKSGYTYPFTYGNDAFAEKCGVMGLPSFVITDGSGKVVFTADYYSDKTAQAIDKTVENLMAAR